MASLIGTMAVLCTAIGIGNYWVTAMRMDKGISILRQNEGTFLSREARFDPSDFSFQVTPETAFETRYFLAELTAQNELRSVSLDHIAALDRRTAADTAQRIVETGAECGYVDHYRFGIFQEPDGGRTVIAVDCFLQLQAASNILRITVCF